MRGQIAADVVGEVEDTVRLRHRHGADHVIELGDVTADHLYRLTEFLKGCLSRIDVHAHHPLAARDQEGNQTPSDESGTTDDENGHRTHSGNGVWRGSIDLVGHMLEPISHTPRVIDLRHRQMDEEAIRPGAVPVPGSGRNDPGISRPELLHALTLQLQSPDS